MEKKNGRKVWVQVSYHSALHFLATHPVNLHQLWHIFDCLNHHLNITHTRSWHPQLFLQQTGDRKCFWCRAKVSQRWKKLKKVWRAAKTHPAEPCGILQWVMQSSQYVNPKENTCCASVCVHVCVDVLTNHRGKTQSCHGAATNSKVTCSPSVFPESLTTVNVWLKMNHIFPRRPAWISP